LNRRLLDGESGGSLVNWLNSIPAVEIALLREFDGRPITEDNISQWRSGGYREWLCHKDASSQFAELAALAGDSHGASRTRIVDYASTLLAALYSRALALSDAGDSPPDLRELNGISHALAALRNTDQNSDRVDIERRRFDREETKTVQDLLEFVLKWLEYPKIRECLSDPKADWRKVVAPRLRELFGLQPQPAPPPIEIEPDIAYRDGLNRGKSD
jgi:hypothetical protein